MPDDDRGMAQITVHRPYTKTSEPEVRRDRLRSAIPVTLAVSLLWGLLMVGVVMLGGMLDFGVWFLTSQ